MNSVSQFKEIFYRMLQTRFLEEDLIEEHRKGNTFGPLHLCIGQEAAGPLVQQRAVDRLYDFLKGNIERFS